MNGTHHFVAIGVLMFLIMTGQALAECVLNGRRLSEGTRIGSLVCEYGQWAEKPEKPQFVDRGRARSQPTAV
jgi:hypothetical protein